MRRGADRGGLRLRKTRRNTLEATAERCARIQASRNFKSCDPSREFVGRATSLPSSYPLRRIAYVAPALPFPPPRLPLLSAAPMDGEAEEPAPGGAEGAEGGSSRRDQAAASSSGSTPHACYLIVHSVAKKHNSALAGHSAAPTSHLLPARSALSSKTDARDALSCCVCSRRAVGTLARSATAFGVAEVLLVGAAVKQLQSSSKHTTPLSTSSFFTAQSVHLPSLLSSLRRFAPSGERSYNSFGSHGSADHCCFKHFPSLAEARRGAGETWECSWG